MEGHNILTIMDERMIRNTKYKGKNYFNNLIKPKALEYLYCQYILKHNTFLDYVSYNRSVISQELLDLHHLHVYTVMTF